MAAIQLAYIDTPSPTGKPVKSLGDFLSASGDWHQKTARKNRGILSDLWYRGVSRHYAHQAPGVYREKFSERAKHLKVAFPRYFAVMARQQKRASFHRRSSGKGFPSPEDT
jgi:hypothetical protein